MPPSRREELIEAAVKVFYHHGFHATNIDRVLQEGGISRMTLYNHFKSKDDLIVAALQRREELFHGAMMKFVDSRAEEPISRVLALFDFHEQWLSGRDFRGCMFINASAEFSDPNDPVRRLAAAAKGELLRYVFEQCEAAQLADPQALAEQICILLEGAIVTAQVCGQCPSTDAKPGDPARRAKEAAERLIGLAGAA